MNFSDILNGYDEYKRLKENIDNAPLSVAGLVDAAQAQFIYQLSKEKRALILAYSDMEAKTIVSGLKFFDDDTIYFPPKDYVFYNIDATARDAERERLGIISKWTEKKDITVVTSVEAILSYTIPKDRFEKNCITVKIGDEFNIDEISELLVSNGYVKEDMVEGVGQFSVRGGIIDIFSPNSENPVRIELFDTEVDSIRSFDALSQRSLENCEEISVIPCREAIFDGKDIDAVFFAGV